MTGPKPGEVTAASQQLVLAGILVMPLAYVVAAYILHAIEVLPPTGFVELGPQATLLLAGVFLLSCVLSAVVSPILKKKILQMAAADNTLDRHARFKASMIAMATSEAGAGLGLVLIFLTGNLLYGTLLCALSFAVTCFHFPRRHWLEDGDTLH